jgi:hypothetical protein
MPPRSAGASKSGAGGLPSNPGLGSNRLRTGFSTPTKKKKQMGGFEVEGDSDDEESTPTRVRIECTPCIEAISYRGRIDCKCEKGKSCTSCQESKRTCVREPALFAANPGLRRSFRKFKDIANRENRVAFKKKGKGTKAKKFSDAVSFRSDSGPRAPR